MTDPARHRLARAVRGTWAIGTAASAAVLGGFSSRNAASVYAQLRKPSWAPPAKLFAPAWTTLYALNAVAAWRIERPSLRALHTAQLALNAAWPATFFRAGDRRTALAVIASMDVMVAVEIAALARTDRIGAAALIPYLGWLGYATALTAAVSDPGDATR